MPSCWGSQSQSGSPIQQANSCGVCGQYSCASGTNNAYGGDESLEHKIRG